MKESISWGDGTTGKIHIKYSGAVGSSEMDVSSDPNPTLVKREKILTFKSNTGIVIGSLLVSQSPRARDYNTDYNIDYK